MPLIVSTATVTDQSVNTLSSSIAIPDGTSMTAFVFVSGQRANTNPDALEFDYSTATLHGSAMTLVATITSTSSNRYFRTSLYKVVDPRDEGTKPATQTLNIVSERSLASFSAVVTFVTGVNEHKTAETLAGETSDKEISLEIVNEAVPSIILAGGMVRDWDTNFDVLTPLGDTVEVVKVKAGSGENTSLLAMVGYADAAILDTFTVGWEWNDGTGDPSHLIALEVVGTLEAGVARGYGADPSTVILGSFLLEDETGTAHASGSVPEIVLGSIPPVQVIGRGNLYFSTAARTLTVLLLATSGDDWVITKAGGDVEELGLTIGRRKGYTVLR